MTLFALTVTVDVHIVEEYRLGPSHIGLRVCTADTGPCELCDLGVPLSKLARGANFGHPSAERIPAFAAWSRAHPFGGER